MKPETDRFRLVEALRLAARIAERNGGKVTVVDATGSAVRTVASFAPRSARLTADELERRWTS